MIPRKLKIIATASLVASIPLSDAFQTTVSHQPTNRVSLAFVRSNHVASSTRLPMQPSSADETQSRRTDKLAAVSIADDWESDKPVFSSDIFTSTILPVLSASLMVTGNTVGAGMLVLPELAAGPGMAVSSSIFIGAFLVNLISGLLISEVAINQYTSSGSDVPSSFKEFAEANLKSPMAANGISSISIFVNSLVMAFNTAKVGDLGSAMSGLPNEAISLGWAAGCLALVGSLGLNSLSGISSMLVSGLFISFAGLLLPGLANMSADPMSILMTPGVSPDVFGSALHLAPIVLMSLVYQNIVPTITKMLGYDRTKTTAAITLGSFIPLVMYVAWTFSVVGGGVDMSAVGSNGLLMSIFSLATIGGSSVGCIMSLSEEFDTFLKPADEKESDRFSLPAVAASVGCSLLAAQFFAGDLNGALKVAGSFGSPLLYGILPVIMSQRQKQEKQKLPGIGLGLLGAASTGMVGNEILQTFGSDIMTTLSL